MCLVIGGGGGGSGARAATTSSLLRLHVFPPWRGLASPIDDAAAVRQQKGPRRLPFRRSSSPIHQQSMYVLKPRPSTKSLPGRSTGVQAYDWYGNNFNWLKGVFSKPSGTPNSCTDSLFLELETSNFGSSYVFTSPLKWASRILPNCTF